jgi:hypothetical protein
MSEKCGIVNEGGTQHLSSELLKAISKYIVTPILHVYDIVINNKRCA